MKGWLNIVGDYNAFQRTLERTGVMDMGQTKGASGEGIWVLGELRQPSTA